MEPLIDQQQIKRLYRELSQAFPHPFDWMGLLEKPPFWLIAWHAPHRQVREIFGQCGFVLNSKVARRFLTKHCSEETIVLDAGGAIMCELAYALDDQIEGSWEDLLNQKPNLKRLEELETTWRTANKARADAEVVKSEAEVEHALARDAERAAWENLKKARGDD